MKLSTQERVVGVVAAHLDVLIVDKSKALEDLGGDSLDAVEITMALEEEFSIQICDETMDSWKKNPTVQQLIDEVTKLTTQS